MLRTTSRVSLISWSSDHSCKFTPERPFARMGLTRVCFSCGQLGDCTHLQLLHPVPRAPRKSSQIGKAVAPSVPKGGREEDFSHLIPPQCCPRAALIVSPPPASTWFGPGLTGSFSLQRLCGVKYISSIS